MKRLKTVEQLAIESAADNAADLKRGKQYPRQHEMRSALARRIRYRRRLWDAWDIQTIRGIVGTASAECCKTCNQPVDVRAYPADYIRLRNGRPIHLACAGRTLQD